MENEMKYFNGNFRAQSKTENVPIFIVLSHENPLFLSLLNLFYVVRENVNHTFFNL